MGILLRLVVVVGAAGTALAQSPYRADSWERALPIGGNYEHASSTFAATQDGASSCDVGESLDVWYVYTPEASGTARFRTRNNVGIDTVMSLHTLDTSGELVSLGCDDDGGLPFGQSLLQWSAQAETPYYLRVTGKNGATGVYLLESLLPSPFGIKPANASRERPLSIWPGDYHGYTRHYAGPPSVCQTLGESAWFVYRPKSSGTATVDTYLFSYNDTAIDVEENGTIIRCTDLSGEGEISSFPVTAGSEYLIRIGSADGPGGIYGMRLQGPECAGQTCEDAEVILEGIHLVSLVGAAPSGSSDCSSGDPDRYFRYVATVDGTLNVGTCGTATAAVQGYSVDARISLHAACPASPLTGLDCSRSSVACAEGFRPQPFASTPVTQGQEILIRLSARADGQLTPIRMEIELAESISVCFGDGSGSSCPCGNTGSLHRGCDHSFGSGGARLYATGDASLTADTLSIAVTDAPPTAPVLLLQGDAAGNGGAGTPFADGLLCVDGTIVRVMGAISTDGASIFGALGGHRLSTAGGVPPPGSTRWYQAYYRNARAFCTPAPANLTNAVRITWVP